MQTYVETWFLFPTKIVSIHDLRLKTQLSSWYSQEPLHRNFLDYALLNTGFEKMIYFLRKEGVIPGYYSAAPS